MKEQAIQNLLKLFEESVLMLVSEYVHVVVCQLKQGCAWAYMQDIRNHMHQDYVVDTSICISRTGCIVFEGLVLLSLRGQAEVEIVGIS